MRKRFYSLQGFARRLRTAGMIRTSILSFLLIVSCGAIVFGVRAHGVARPGALGSAILNPVVAPPLRTTGQRSPTPQVGPAQGRFVTIRVFIHPEDIYPGSVVVKPGKIDLVAENETLTDVSLVVERVNPGQAHQSIAAVRTVDHRKRNRQELTLDAGVYVFYEESRPQQQGTIIVDPHDR